MRTQSSIKNLKFAIVGQGIGVLVSFIARIAFIQYLGTEYLGLNGLFTNILTILSLVELGVGPAMNFSLYKPLAENDTEKVKSLMKLYQKAYVLIGIVVTVLGLSILPFLEIFLREIPDIPNINIIYALFVANTAISYFFSYKRSLIISDQKRYIATFYRYAFFSGLNILQIIVLFLTQNFILFLLLQIFATFTENIVVSKRADDLYPYLKDKNVKKIDKETLNQIIKNVKAMVIHKLGGIVVNSTDNILISRFVGLTQVGLYSNYLLVISSLNLIIAQVFSSITASVGNLGATDKNRTELIFNVTLFINFWIYGMISILLTVVFNPFIELWIGKDYIFTSNIVLVLILNFYLNGMRKAVLTFREAMGLYWQDRYKPIFESVINLVVSLILVKSFGIIGVFIGTTVSTITTCLLVEPYVLYKYGFKSSVRPYFTKFSLYTVVAIITCVITFSSGILFDRITLFNFIMQLLISVLVPNIIFILVFYKSKEFKFLYGILNNFVIKKLKGTSRM